MKISIGNTHVSHMSLQSFPDSDDNTLIEAEPFSFDLCRCERIHGFDLQKEPSRELGAKP